MNSFSSDILVEESTKELVLSLVEVYEILLENLVVSDDTRFEVLDKLNRIKMMVCED